MCLLIVGFICRAIYLRKSVAAKLIFLLFQIFAWHLWLLFILPASPVTDRSVTTTCAHVHARVHAHVCVCVYLCVSVTLVHNLSSLSITLEPSQTMDSHKHSTSSRASTSYCQPNSVSVGTPKEFWDISLASNSILWPVLYLKCENADLCLSSHVHIMLRYCIIQL